MSAVVESRAVRTYVPEAAQDTEILDFVHFLDGSGIEVPGRRPALVAADGTTRELPEALFDALHQVADALARGMGVVIAPQHAMLTTQEAADFLGLSRPTLVRLLEGGEIPFELRGRHRRVMLRNLLDYQERSRRDRRRTLDELAADAEELGLYTVTTGDAPATR